MALKDKNISEPKSEKTLREIIQLAISYEMARSPRRAEKIQRSPKQYLGPIIKELMGDDFDEEAFERLDINVHREKDDQMHLVVPPLESIHEKGELSFDEAIAVAGYEPLDSLTAYRSHSLVSRIRVQYPPKKNIQAAKQLDEWTFITNNPISGFTTHC